VRCAPLWCKVAPRITWESDPVESGRKSVRTSVMLPERAYERVQELATANDVSAAWVMRQAILKFLEGQEGKRELPLKSPGTPRAKRL
jgi:hypothetical protein